MIDIKPKNILEQPIYLLTKATPCPYLKGRVEKRIATDLSHNNEIYNELAINGFRKHPHHQSRENRRCRQTKGQCHRTSGKAGRIEPQPTCDHNRQRHHHAARSELSPFRQARYRHSFE